MAKLKNMEASVHQRLLNLSRDTKRPFMELLQYYGMERFLLRMSKSEHVESFVLKGALLLRIVGMNEVRPTRDIDLLGMAGEDIERLENIIRDCCTVKVEDDGLVFHPDTVKGKEIRGNQTYQGVRITFKGYLAAAEISMQIDIGFGDVVSPQPLLVEYPVLLDGESPELLAYTLESAVAEKYQAMVSLDLANSRMKDFYDIWYLSQNHEFKSYDLAEAIKQTFKRRKTALPAEPPTALTDEFFNNDNKLVQWNAYRKKVSDFESPETLKEAVICTHDFIWPVNAMLLNEKIDKLLWKPDKGWTK